MLHNVGILTVSVFPAIITGNRRVFYYEIISKNYFSFLVLDHVHGVSYRMREEYGNS